MITLCDKCWDLLTGHLLVGVKRSQYVKGQECVFCKVPGATRNLRAIGQKLRGNAESAMYDKLFGSDFERTLQKIHADLKKHYLEYKDYDTLLGNFRNMLQAYLGFRDYYWESKS